MKAAKDVGPRARVVVLNELRVHTELCPGRGAERFDQEAALVPVHLRLEQHRPLETAMRAVLGNTRPPTPRQATAHLAWRPLDLFQFYIGCLLVSTAGRYLADVITALDQPMEAVARIKIVALLMLFGGVMSTGKGVGFLLAAVMFELMIGFSGILGDFRSVFIILFISALAVRIR